MHARWFLRRPVLVRAALAVLGVVALAAAGTWAVRVHRAAGLESQRVVVAPFENATGDSALNPLGRLASDWITQGLVQADIPGVVSSATTLGPTAREAEGTAEARLLRLAKAAHARTVVSGAYYRQGDSLRFQARISDAATGEIIAALDPVLGPARSPLDAVGDLRQRVMAALAAHVEPRLAAWGTDAAKPPRYEAYLAYAAGLEECRGLAPKAARDAFHRAFALDPTFTLALLLEAQVENNIAPGGPAIDSILQHLEQVRARLTRYGQLRLDWLEASHAADCQRLYMIQRRLVEASGGADEEQRELALEAMRLNRPREGVGILERLDASVQGWTPRESADYWGLLAKGLHMLSDYRGELRAYRRGLAAGTREWSTEYAGLRSLAALGRYGELQQALDEAVSRTQDPGWIGWYYIVAGTELIYHVRRDSGLAVLRRGIVLLRAWASKGADSLEANRRGVLAYLLYSTGDWEGCGAERRGLKQPRIVDELLCPPWVLAARRGDRAEAQRLLAEADSQLRGASALARAWALVAHARVAAILGDREDAMAHLRQAMPSLGFEQDVIDLHTDIDFDSLRDYPPFQELLRPKG